MLEFLNDRKTEEYAFDCFFARLTVGDSAIKCERSDFQKGQWAMSRKRSSFYCQSKML